MSFVRARRKNTKTAAAAKTGRLGILAGSAAPEEPWQLGQEATGSPAEWLWVASSTCAPNKNSRANTAKYLAVELLYVGLEENIRLASSSLLLNYTHIQMISTIVISGLRRSRRFTGSAMSEVRPISKLRSHGVAQCARSVLSVSVFLPRLSDLILCSSNGIQLKKSSKKMSFSRDIFVSIDLTCCL